MRYVLNTKYDIFVSYQNRYENILIWLPMEIEGAFYLPKRALEQSFIWIRVLNCVGYMWVEAE